ncbi:hypothetical protein AFUB_085700 [Aspergillus fumigatus A1163]|uniref:Uncharacterized protein n=1 Tax=Aspergillus fumigatus (strain CBS 144.89 / FGSC A1163 / CEA10) TaxID=451804 RepID=B0YAS8_ASPFC|nr:hypothetical protein AFUB_085700 [Aspergillus fumigatus A1163]KEY77950.1 hypothetical protein BA78_8501 [Aspergillus fumigatus]
MICPFGALQVSRSSPDSRIPGFLTDWPIVTSCGMSYSACPAIWAPSPDFRWNLAWRCRCQGRTGVVYNVLVHSTDVTSTASPGLRTLTSGTMYRISNIYVLAAFGTIGGALFGFDVR